MAATIRDHNQKLLEAHTRRLQKLQIEQANLGSSTPPEVSTEIEDIQARILQITASIGALETVDDFARNTPIGSKVIDRRDESNQDMRLGIMVATVQATVAEVSSVKAFVSTEVKRLENLVYRIGYLFGFVILMLVIFTKLGWL